MHRMMRWWLGGWVVLGMALGLSACSQGETATAPQEDLHYKQLGRLIPGERLGVTVQDPWGRLQALEAGVNRSGQVIYQGDIVLGSASQLATQGAIVPSRRWDNATVPFVICNETGGGDPVMPETCVAEGAVDMPDSQLEQLEQAMAYYETHTPIRFVPRSDESDYVLIVFSGSGACNSYVGRIGGEQILNFSDWCELRGALHELGHVIGLHHEHARSDRDAYISFACHLIDCNDPLWTVRSEARPYGDYDYYSIMHYSAFYGGEQVIFPLDPSVNPYLMGQGEVLSAFDLSAVSALYPTTFGAMIQVAGSGKCVDVSRAAQASVQLFQWPCHGAQNQQFTFIPVEDAVATYTIVSQGSGKCLDIQYFGQEDGASLMLWACHGGPNQRFELSSTAGGAQLMAVHSAKCLEVKGESSDNRAVLQQGSCSSSPYQRFALLTAP